MDGANNGKPYEQMDDLGEKKTIFGSTPTWLINEGDPNPNLTQLHPETSHPPSWVLFGVAVMDGFFLLGKS